MKTTLLYAALLSSMSVIAAEKAPIPSPRTNTVVHSFQGEEANDPEVKVSLKKISPERMEFLREHFRQEFDEEIQTDEITECIATVKLKDNGLAITQVGDVMYGEIKGEPFGKFKSVSIKIDDGKKMKFKSKKFIVDEDFVDELKNGDQISIVFNEKSLGKRMWQSSLKGLAAALDSFQSCFVSQSA